jgi:multidrug efflux pump subunit AcrA (membrane-fusion protein)
MIRYLLLLLTPILIIAKVHYAKVEPYENIILKSAVSAQVTEVKLELEGTTVGDDIVIQLDSQLNETELTSHQNSLQLIDNMIATNQSILEALQESRSRQEEYYYNISKLVSIPKTKKDTAFYNYISTKTQYLSTQEKIETLSKQQNDIRYNIKRLQDQISKKTIFVHNKFIYKILVNKGDFVNMGTPLVQLKDLSQAKLVLFLDAKELKNINAKTIYIDGKKTHYHISKQWRVADEKFISSFRAEILIDNPQNRFSKLVKVEFR